MERKTKVSHVAQSITFHNIDFPFRSLGQRSNNSIISFIMILTRLTAIDLVQQHILKSGDQSHETFLEQMKDEQISDAIRRQYKNLTGHDFPLKDKE